MVNKKVPDWMQELAKIEQEIKEKKQLERAFGKEQEEPKWQRKKDVEPRKYNQRRVASTKTENFCQSMIGSY